MRRHARHLAALLAGAALVAGCGGDDEPKGEGLPADSASAIEERLDEIQRRFDDASENNNVGACNDIEADSFRAIAASVADLPSDVDPDVRDALESGLDRLRQLTEEGCAGVEPPKTETTPEETVPEETVTETVPEETTPETETEPQQTAPEGRGPDGQGPPGQGGGGTVPPSDDEGE